MYTKCSMHYISDLRKLMKWWSVLQMMYKCLSLWKSKLSVYFLFVFLVIYMFKMMLMSVSLLLDGMGIIISLVLKSPQGLI